jgi:aminoglycoside 6'-N-acetyltransferase
MTASQLTVRRSDVEPGESWVEAAIRRSGDPHTKPWAVDLSRETLVFGVGQGPGDVASVEIRPLVRQDFPVIVAWKSMPHVKRWWNDEARTVRDIEQHYGAALDGTEPTRLWVVRINGGMCGFLQDYLIGDHPEYAILTAKPDAVGFDYLIGDPNLVGKGVGTRVLWSFLADHVAPHYPEATTFFAAPDHRNIGSLRMLAKLGFSQGLWFDEPQPGGRVDTVVGCSFDVPTILGRP